MKDVKQEKATKTYWEYQKRTSEKRGFGPGFFRLSFEFSVFIQISFKFKFGKFGFRHFWAGPCDFEDSGGSVFSSCFKDIRKIPSCLAV